MKERCDRFEKKISLFFKISYLILAITTFNSFTFGMPVMSVLVIISFVLGVATICLRLVNWKNYIRMPMFWLLISFCISFLISMVANIQYGFIENFKWLIWTSFQLLILYTMDANCKPEYYKREFKILSYIVIIYSFFAAAVSIILMLIQFQQIVELENQRILRGFFWGRLWGVYTDPNYGSVISSISIILSLFLCQYCRKKIKIFLYVNIIFQLLYIVFSDSRTGLVSLLVGISLFTYMHLLRKETRLAGIKKYLKNILIVLGVVVITFVGTQLIKITYNNVVVPVLSEFFYEEGLEVENPEEEKELAKIGREEDINVDPSNRRFDIWKSGLEIFKTTPVVGTSYISFLPYVEDNLPDTYVVNNDHGNFGNMHNEYLNVLVYQGVIGAVILVLFIVRAIYIIFNNMFKLENQKFYYYSMLFTLVAIVAAAMMFVLEGVYTNSVGAFVFWSALGYLVHFLSYKKMGGSVS